MDLKEIEEKLKNVRKESRDMDWKMAVYQANNYYKEKYINTLSLNYRKTTEWWNEFGDDFFEYFKKNPVMEAQIKKWYFENKH